MKTRNTTALARDNSTPLAGRVRRGQPPPEPGSKGTTAGRARRSPLSGATTDRERLRTALHDGLGQLLTSISFLASSLKQKLAAQKMPEATEADEIVALTARAISETQSLAGNTFSRATAD